MYKNIYIYIYIYIRLKCRTFEHSVTHNSAISQDLLKRI